MTLGTVLIPTWSGHLDEATGLVESIRAHQSLHIPVVLVISADERPVFADLAQRLSCAILDIETLVNSYAGITASGGQLLSLLNRFRFQALKKLLGAATLDGLVLIMDSESRVSRDLAPVFEGGLSDTTVIYTARPWNSMPRTLTTEVYEEACYLLGDQPNWYFESFNWLYSTDLVRDLLDALKERHGPRWIMRPKPLFESQLYFQFAQERHAAYRFMQAGDVLAIQFGQDRAKAILKTIYASPRGAFGVFEYLPWFVTRAEYIAFVGNPEVHRHFRLLRHEPLEFFDIVSAVRKQVADSPSYFGEAAMHRGALVKGRTAVLLTGLFLTERDVYNAQRFLAGVDCDVFVATSTGNWLLGLIRDVLNPSAIIELDDDAALADRHLALADASAQLLEKDVKPARDIGSMAMFDKIDAALRAMLSHEIEQGVTYGVVVRLRPDIFSTRTLRDVLWEASENLSTFKNIVLLPNRFWSQGVNDQLFLGLRSTMVPLLSQINGAAYLASDFRNPEHFLAGVMRNLQLKPIIFELPYVLTRSHYADLPHISGQYHEQERLFWSRTIPFPLWTDATPLLRTVLANVRVKNGQMSLPRVQSARDGSVEYQVLRAESGASFVLIAEWKSPYVFIRRIPWRTRNLVPHLISSGALRPVGRPATLRQVSLETGRIEIAWGHEGVDGGTPVSFEIVETRNPLVLRGVQWSGRSIRDAGRRAKSAGWSGLRAGWRAIRQARSMLTR